MCRNNDAIIAENHWREITRKKSLERNHWEGFIVETGKSPWKESQRRSSTAIT